MAGWGGHWATSQVTHYKTARRIKLIYLVMYEWLSWSRFLMAFLHVLLVSVNPLVSGLTGTYRSMFCITLEQWTLYSSMVYGSMSILTSLDITRIIVRCMVFITRFCVHVKSVQIELYTKMYIKALKFFLFRFSEKIFPFHMNTCHLKHAWNNELKYWFFVSVLFYLKFKTAGIQIEVL